MDIGNVIRYFLRKKDLTQRWLSNEMGIDEKTLSGKLIRDSITADELLQIGKFLNINLNKLMRGEYYMLKYFTTSKIEILDKNEELSESVYNKINENPQKYKIVDNDEGIIYRQKDEKKIGDELGIDLSKYSEDFEKYIEGFDGGQWSKFGSIEITISDCICMVQDELENYEERIYESNDVDEEINCILKEKAMFLLDMKSAEVLNKIESEKDAVKQNGFEWGAR